MWSADVPAGPVGLIAVFTAEMASYTAASPSRSLWRRVFTAAGAAGAAARAAAGERSAGR